MQSNVQFICRGKKEQRENKPKLNKNMAEYNFLVLLQTYFHVIPDQDDLNVPLSLTKL